jgi:hypothetical protein
MLFFNTFVISVTDFQRILAYIAPDIDNIVDIEQERFNVRRYILEIQSDVCYTHEQVTRVWLESQIGTKFRESQICKR